MRTWRELPPTVRRVLVGDLLSAVGSGLVLPFLFVYLSHVRGLGPGVAGIAVGLVAVGALVANPLAGRAVDAWGSRPVLQCGLVLAASGDLLLVRAHSPLTAGLSTALFGLGAGMILPALHSLLAAAAPPEHRPAAFALQYALMNVGLAVGAVIAAGVVDFADAASFHRVYLADAVTFGAFALLLARTTLRSGPEPAGEGAAGGYRDVLADRRFLLFCSVSFLLVTAGFAQFHGALPGYAGREGGLTAGQLAAVFAANMVVVGGLQLPVLHATGRLDRERLIMAGALCFAASWVLVYLSGRVGGLAALLVVAAGAAVMGLGETFLSPALGPMVNALAPEHLRGRYNGVDAVVLSSGSAIGPALAGWALAHGDTGMLFGGLAAANLGAALLARRLGHHRPEQPCVATGALVVPRPPGRQLLGEDVAPDVVRDGVRGVEDHHDFDAALLAGKHSQYPAHDHDLAVEVELEFDRDRPRPRNRWGRRIARRPR